MSSVVRFCFVVAVEDFTWMQNALCPRLPTLPVDKSHLLLNLVNPLIVVGAY